MTKTLTEQYSKIVFLKDDQVQQRAYTLTKMKPDYSKMYFIFNFTDGKQAKFRMDKDCNTMQQFLDRMNHFHDLEKENKRLQKRNEKLEKMAFHYTPEEWNTMLRKIEHLQEQLHEANEVIKQYATGTAKIKAKKYWGSCYITDPFTGEQKRIEDWGEEYDADVPMSNDDKPAKKYLNKWGVK